MKPAPLHTLARLSACGLGTLVLLAGCAAPVPVTLDTDVPTHWLQALPAGSHTVNTDLAHWWKAWNDAELNALVDEALTQNLDVAQAMLRLRQQRRLAESADATFLPTVSAGMRTLQDIAALDSYFHASVDVSWDLGLFGASEAAKRSASSDVLDAQAQLHAARVALVAEVVHRYLDMRLAQRQQTLHRQLQALNQRHLQLLQIRQTQRLGSTQAVEQQQLQLAATSSQQALLKAAQSRAAHELAALLGRTRPDPRWLQLAEPPAWSASSDMQTMPLPTVPADLLRNRPDLQSAEAAVERAAAELGISRAALYPRFTLTGSLLYSFNLTQNRRNTSSDKLPAFGPQIDIPLFDWSRRRAQADASELALQASLKAYRQSVLNGIADVESSLAAMGAQQQRLQSLQVTQTVLSQRQQTQSVRQKLGLESELSGMETQRSALQAKSEAETAGSAQALAYVALYKALGGAPLDTETSVRRPQP